jgi:hypothetical protein
MVAEGVYFENIAFSGNDITLQSTEPTNPDVVATTIIDGNQGGAVVTFAGTETARCVLSGFTITHGHGHPDEGGGGVNGDGTRATIQNNTITANSAHGGGGLCGCHGAIQNNTITRNSAGGDGGGLRGCDATIRNNIIAGNSAYYGGGLHDCDSTISNNTISGNTAVWGGGGLAYCDGLIWNCIVWDNEAGHEGAQLYECSLRLYSCIQDGAGWGQHNMQSDPLFMDVVNGDFHLSPSSPCVDAGDNAYAQYNDPEDPSRPGYALYPALGTTRNDIGAYGGPEARELPTAPTESEGIGCFGGAIMSNNTPGGSSNGDALLLTITVASLLAAASKKHPALSDG